MSDKTKIKSNVKVTISNTEDIEKVIAKCTNVISFDDLCKLDDESKESNK